MLDGVGRWWSRQGTVMRTSPQGGHAALVPLALPGVWGLKNMSSNVLMDKD